MNNTYFYKDKPIFGLDIGFSSVKVMQVTRSSNGHAVTGYGVANFDHNAIENGVIVNHEVVAKALNDLFKKDLQGQISTRRVAFSVPAARTFSRILLLPKLAEKDLAEAVRLEAEQYIPVPIDELYLDFTIVRKTDKNVAVMAVAVPKKLIDSYSLLGELLGLDIVTMESTTGASTRLFKYTDTNAVPTVLIDFGSVSADIAVYDKGIIVTSTIPGGGDDVTNIIAKSLNVSKDEAHLIKIKYGLNVSKKQKEITQALNPMLIDLIKEVRRMLRYYEQRSPGSNHKIEQIVTFGGGANIPGLSEYMIDQLRLPVRACDPWKQVAFKHLQPPNDIERSMYITVAGLALINPGEIFA
jgi:type IV pilus assembly protein PilM